MDRLHPILAVSGLRDSWSRVLLGALLALGLVWGPSPASAQDGVRDGVQTAIAMTDRRIEQAQSLLAEQRRERAAAELAVALDLQGRARNAFAAAQYEIALRLTREARVRADRAIALVRGLPDPDRVELQLERTRQVIERARDRLQGCDEPRARTSLRVAVEMQARAEVAYRESRYLAALQLTMSARERGEKALRLCRADEGVSEAAARALRHTDDLIPRAREVVQDSGSEVAAALLVRAEAAQAEAWREMRADRAAAALRLTQNARLLLQRAMRLASQAGDRAR